MCKCGKKLDKGEKLCNKCFLRVVSKRIKRELHNYRWFEKTEKVRIIDDGSSRAQILEEELVPLLKKAKIDVKIVKKKMKNTKIIVTDNLDDYAHDLIQTMTENKKWEKDELVRPLKQISDREINRYAKIKKLRSFKRKKDEIIQFLNDIEKRSPETKFAILKSGKELLD